LQIKLDDLIKIAITATITAALTFNIQVTITNNNYDKLADDVQENTVKVNKTIDKINQLGNNIKLSDQQILQIVKQILKEVK
jgi:hypothetical protein